MSTGEVTPTSYLKEIRMMGRKHLPINNSKILCIFIGIFRRGIV